MKMIRMGGLTVYRDPFAVGVDCLAVGNFDASRQKLSIAVAEAVDGGKGSRPAITVPN
ncbi:hypothetical protein [Sodalis-like endosymbiont of Proechinophthirus fluctus]|uniref:hypothetical protein n=1 Tax=Sodalis-like endosymbiont of Proechinophthirus fluctus TaxID=1462730 RepID=UPI00165035E4|nr:hypothetical protein [Sodalis-like endosymbiont of Proechinophthirus fluctus]